MNTPAMNSAQALRAALEALPRISETDGCLEIVHGNGHYLRRADVFALLASPNSAQPPEPAAPMREVFEDRVFNDYFIRSITRNPNPPVGTGAMDFIATADKTQAELCERDGESYKDEAIGAMWHGWKLRTALRAPQDAAATASPTDPLSLALGLEFWAAETEGRQVVSQGFYDTLHAAADYLRALATTRPPLDLMGVDASRHETERSGEAVQRAADEVRLLFVARAVDGWGEVDIHDEAFISAAEHGREEPTNEDYLAAVRIALDAAVVADEKPRRSKSGHPNDPDDADEISF